jgi:uncharacterized phage-like protein YoqJ
MPKNDTDLAAQVASLQEQVADLQRQTFKLFEYHGQKWSIIERQRLENIAGANEVRANTRSTTAQEHGGVRRPKPHEADYTGGVD